ncbi:MAG: Clp protease N-terminal domain-containing protein, partial [Candidatus Paceibacterota bacterium]
MVGFLINDTQSLRWLGFLLSLFLINRIINLGKGEKEISEIEKKIENKKEINIAETLTPRAYKLISKSMRKSLALNKNFELILLEKLLKEKDVKETLKRLSIDANNLLSKIEEYDEEKSDNEKDKLISNISELVKIALVVAIETGESFIEPRSLLVAIAKNPENEIKKIFETFDITPGDLDDAIIFGRYKNLFSKIKKMPTVLGGFAHQRK